VAAFTVVYDACVLYPPSVRDLLVELARTGLCRAKWTQRIHQEWIDAVMIGRADGQRARRGGPDLGRSAGPAGHHERCRSGACCVE
jgi:hypothetical protein